MKEFLARTWKVWVPSIVLSFTVIAILIVKGTSESQVQYRFDTVSRGDIQVYVTATGTINPVTTVEVGTQVSGIIAKLYADYNSVVKKGQLIAQIDTTFLVQAVRDAEANLEKARAQYADSKRAFERVKSLYERNLESQATYDAALTALETSAALVKSAEASLERAKVNLSYAKIYAPIDGVVIDRKVNVGQTVAASFSSPTLYTIANDLRKMQVEATVDESDIGRVSTGQHVTFTVDAYPEEKFEGVVSQIRLAPTTIQNVVNYVVIIDVDNTHLKLMPGMTANVKILVGEAFNVLRVPNMALRFQPPSELVDTTRTESQQQPSQHSHEKKDRVARTGGTRFHPSVTSQEQFSTAQPVGQQALLPPTRRTYGIIPTFPEYQKSAYDASKTAGFGRVWIANEKGKLVPVHLRTGLNDGKYTEIRIGPLNEGQKIVTGLLSNNTPTQTSPLTRSTTPMGGPPR
ncbi:MAG: efflux RND transporter periplasmic adaptor subunit [Bacteroidetes bacterium]|nr:efflux RND transporter periplasmic adaptor subunit [Bacteroidota bacterium]